MTINIGKGYIKGTEKELEEYRTLILIFKAMSEERIKDLVSRDRCCICGSKSEFPESNPFLCPKCFIEPLVDKLSKLEILTKDIPNHNPKLSFLIKDMESRPNYYAQKFKPKLLELHKQMNESMQLLLKQERK